MTEIVTQNKVKIIATTPSDFDQVGVVIRYDFLKYLRSRRLLGIIAIEALVLLLITALPPLLGRPYASNADGFINNYATFVTILVVIGATLFAGDAIVSEYQSHTGFLLFPNPVKKWVLLTGKFIASTGAMFLVLVIYYGVALGLGLAITGGFSTLGVESLLLAMLYALAALAVGYLASTVMKGSTGALILTFALFLFIFNIVQEVLSLANVNPSFILTFAGGTVGYITQVPYPVTSSATFGKGAQSITMTTFIPDIGVSIAVMVCYFVVALALSYFFFKRREMAA